MGKFFFHIWNIRSKKWNTKKRYSKDFCSYGHSYNGNDIFGSPNVTIDERRVQKTEWKWMRKSQNHLSKVYSINLKVSQRFQCDCLVSMHQSLWRSASSCHGNNGMQKEYGPSWQNSVSSVRPLDNTYLLNINVFQLEYTHLWMGWNKMLFR